VNNGQQSSRGVELAAAWRATKQLTLSGNVAALDARFDTLTEAGGVSRVGNTPPNVPERIVNLFANYRFKDVPVDLFLSVNRTGKMYTDNANQIRINGYTTADVAASWRVKPVLLTFRVRNLTDKLYASYAGRATTQVLLAPQRTFELSAKYDF
ncbi:MAG: TonB-dependent receptor, partial [Comamonadaceae bacterium]